MRLDVVHPFHLLLAFSDCVLKMGSIPSALSPHTDRFPSAHSELVSLRPLHLSLSGNTLFDTVCIYLITQFLKFKSLDGDCLFDVW